MEYILTVSINLYQLIIACLVLALFGMGYNAWVAHLKRNGDDRGFMSLIVVVGCAVTGVVFGLATDPWLILPFLLCFGASGTPMALGSIHRYIDERRRAQAELDASTRRRLGG